MPAALEKPQAQGRRRSMMRWMRASSSLLCFLVGVDVCCESVSAGAHDVATTSVVVTTTKATSAHVSKNNDSRCLPPPTADDHPSRSISNGVPG